MKTNRIKIIAAIFVVLVIAVFTTVWQLNLASSEDVPSLPPEIANFDQPPTYQINVKDLPKPFASESARRSSRIVAQPKDARLSVPKGFKAEVFAEGNFQQPRWMTLAPNGDVFVADSRANSIVVLRDANKDGKIAADERFTFADDLSQPFGMAFNGDYFYVANTDAVVRYKYKSGQTKAVGAPEKIIELTEGGYNQHWTRNILFSPDGKKLYVSIGSSGNVDIETDERRAGISEYNPDGTGYRLYASGLRNPIGLAWNPANGQLWTAVNERDGLGDDLVPDYVTAVKDGGFYGFPYYYLGMNKDPRRDEKIKLAAPPIVPDVLITSHSAALGIQFYTGTMFPKEYQGDAFVALHGSWNREKLTGYKIIRVNFENGKLVNNGYEDFVSGWLPSETSQEVWGRPVGLLVNSDGSLLIADDGAKKIWRVSYAK